jgi:hypothetical protein
MLIGTHSKKILSVISERGLIHLTISPLTPNTCHIWHVARAKCITVAIVLSTPRNVEGCVRVEK